MSLAALHHPLASLQERFVTLTEPHRPDLWRFCLRLTGSPWDAEDLVQETLARTFARLAQHRQPEELRPYLFRTASNAWIDQQRRLGRMAAWEEEMDHPAVAEEVADTLAAMEHLVAYLSPRQRVVLLLADVFGFTAPEVAAMIGSTVGAVKAALHRGRAALRQALAEPEEEPPVRPAPAVLSRYLDAFNRRDPDGIAALLTEEATFENVGESRVHGREAIRRDPLAFWAQGSDMVRAELGHLHGRPVLFSFGRDGRLDSIVAPEVVGDQVVAVRDYYFCPEMIRYAADRLGVEPATHGYHWVDSAPVTPGRVVAFELSSQEPELAVALYENLFGWRFWDPRWDYWPAVTGPAGRPGIDGGVSRGPADFPHGTRVVIEVAEMASTIARAVSLGARVLRPAMDFDTFVLAYLIDPAGVAFGLIQPKR